MVETRDVEWFLRHTVVQSRLRSCFIGPHRFLGAMEYEDGWTGRTMLLPSGENATRGRGYAVRVLDGDELQSRAVDGPKAFGKWVVSIVEEMASALGTEIEKALRGDAKNRAFADVQGDATMSGISVGAVDFTPIDAPAGYKFAHLCEVPHLVMDDGLRVSPRLDGVELRLRVLGNAVPIGSRMPE